ncbi:MAG: hypothetical protein K6D02_04385 [Lachnospiraceae bacterium]|nr:hypothetical protein [Lachnospiraceae bacterium]
MNYEEAIDYLNNIKVDMNVKYTLDTIKRGSELFDNPHLTYPTVHIAGTNGKGAVGEFMAKALSKCGLKVGRYMSPAVIDRREIISLYEEENHNPTYISKEDYGELITDIVKKLEDNNLTLSAFEIETLLSFLMFKKWKVDIAIIECGMGGSLDATNIIKPVLSILTSISMDHMGFLGNTLLEIANNKFGIIKEKTPVISIIQEKNVMEELILYSEKQGSKLYVTGEEKLLKDSIEKEFEGSENVKIIPVTDINISKEVSSFKAFSEALNIKAKGTYMVDNAALAFTAVKLLITGEVKEVKSSYNEVCDERIEKAINAINNTTWPGRFEFMEVNSRVNLKGTSGITPYNPLIILDGAHNPGAFKRLMESLDTYFPNEKFAFIYGTFKDKDYEKNIEYILNKAFSVFTVSAPTKRGMDFNSLSDIIKRLDKKHILKSVKGCENIEIAVLEALECARENNINIVICGSLSLQRDVKDVISKL